MLLLFFTASILCKSNSDFGGLIGVSQILLLFYIYIYLIVNEATGKCFLITLVREDFFLFLLGYSYNCRAIVEFQLVFMHPCTRFYYHVKMAMQNLAGRLQINLKLIWAFKSLCKLR